MLKNTAIKFEWRTFLFSSWDCKAELQSTKVADSEKSDIDTCCTSNSVKVMDCGIVVNEFILQLRYYIHFQANTFGKGMNPLILPAMG